MHAGLRRHAREEEGVAAERREQPRHRAHEEGLREGQRRARAPPAPPVEQLLELLEDEDLRRRGAGWDGAGWDGRRVRAATAREVPTRSDGMVLQAVVGYWR